MAESKDFSAEAGTAKVVGTVSSTDIAEPVTPPTGLRAVGPRITFHFAGEWNAETSYVLYDVVRVNGTSYIANKVSIAKGVDPETDNNVHWVKWNDPNSQVELLQQTVNGFDVRITGVETEAATAAADAAAAKTASAANAAAISEEAARAKEAEGVNAAAIETNATAISAEVTRAKAAEAANTAAIETNATAISAEVTRAKAAEAANTAAIETEEMRAKKEHDFKNFKAVAFGDSLTYGTGASTTWCKILEEMTGSTVKNYSKEGQGFVNTVAGKKFVDQINDAPQDPSVDYVFIIGGYNDYAQSDANISAQVKSCVSAAKTKFTNAIVYVGAMLKGVYPLDYTIGGATAGQYRSSKIKPIEQAAIEAGAIVLSHPWLWCFGDTRWESDNVHVNSAGQEQIAHCLYAAMQGKYQLPTFSRFIDASLEGVNFNTMRATVQEGMVSIHGNITTTAEIGVDAVLATVTEDLYCSNYDKTSNYVFAHNHTYHPSTDEGCRVIFDGGNIISEYLGVGTSTISLTYPYGI